MKSSEVLGVPDDMVVGMVVGKFSVRVLLRNLTCKYGIIQSSMWECC